MSDRAERASLPRGATTAAGGAIVWFVAGGASFKETRTAATTWAHFLIVIESTLQEKVVGEKKNESN